VLKASTDLSNQFTSSEDYTPLQGILPPETVLLTELQDFIISGMEVRGTLANHFFNATKLQDLILADTLFEGTIPADLANQNPDLRTLILSNNNFNGTLPMTLGSLTNLTDLQVNGNKLSGPLADAVFSPLTRLRKYNWNERSCYSYSASHTFFPSQKTWSCRRTISLAVYQIACFPLDH